jgi:hypothetical protein
MRPDLLLWHSLSSFGSADCEICSVSKQSGMAPMALCRPISGPISCHSGVTVSRCSSKAPFHPRGILMDTTPRSYTCNLSAIALLAFSLGSIWMISQSYLVGVGVISLLHVELARGH